MWVPLVHLLPQNINLYILIGTHHVKAYTLIWPVIMNISVLTKFVRLTHHFSCVPVYISPREIGKYLRKCELLTSGSRELCQLIRQWTFWLYSVIIVWWVNCWNSRPSYRREQCSRSREGVAGPTTDQLLSVCQH